MTQPSNLRLLTEDQAAPLSTATPASPSTSPSAGSSSETSRSDHVHPAAGLFAYYGDGSDGDLNFDGTNTFSFASKSGNVYTLSRPIFADDIVISAGVTIRPGGQIIHATGTVSGTGTIAADTGIGSFNMRIASIGPGAVGPAGGTGAGAAGVVSDSSVGVNGASGAGGLGSSGAGGASAAPNSVFANSATIIGGVVQYQVRTPVTAFTGLMHKMDWQSLGTLPVAHVLRGGSSGGAGGGDGTNSGGKGGNGGQCVIVNARRITGSVTITANAENGGNASAGNCGGGGGGTGGIVILNTTSTTGWTGALTAAAGAGGTKTGTGVAGAAGSAGLTRLNLWA